MTSKICEFALEITIVRESKLANGEEWSPFLSFLKRENYVKQVEFRGVQSRVTTFTENLTKLIEKFSWKFAKKGLLTDWYW